MLWEQFKNIASQILSDHFAPNLIEDNGLFIIEGVGVVCGVGRVVAG